MSQSIEGYDVPPEAIEAAAKQIEYAVGGGVDPEHIVVQVLRVALPIIFPGSLTLEDARAAWAKGLSNG